MMSNKMKKTIFATIIFVITNISISFAEQFRSKWGVVMSVTPVTLTSNYSEPYTKVYCKKSYRKQTTNFTDIAVGGLIGSVIGNTLSDAHGAGTVGALFGSMLAVDNSNRSLSETCYEKTYYSNKKISKFSHYNIQVRTKRRITNIQSTTPYNVHDVIYLN